MEMAVDTGDPCGSDEVDRDRLAAIAQAAGTEIETLAGQSFGPAKQNSVAVNTCGLPFVELPGLLIGSQEVPHRHVADPQPGRPAKSHHRPGGRRPAAGYTRNARRVRVAGRQAGLVHAAAQAGSLGA